MKNIVKSKWMILLAVVVAILVTAAFTFGRAKEPKYLTDKVQQGDIHNVVEATGTINAVTTVQVGSQVSGTISKLNADFNSHVKKGQVIAELDPSLFQGALLQAEADYQNAVANAAAAQANYEKARATATQAQTDNQRNAALAKEGVISAQALDAAKATADSAVAAVNAAKAQVTQANAQTAQKRAAVDVAKTNLDHTIIRSPIDGVVVARSIDIGQTVAASLQAPTLFSIAEDLTKMQVYAKTDESDVGQMKVGAPVVFKVDAFPTESFNGRVAQIRMNPTTVQNVVTYDTIIDFGNPDMKLFPGMTAYVTIPVSQANDTLKVPNAALRFKPATADAKTGGQAKNNAPNGAPAQGQQTSRRGGDATMATVYKVGAKGELTPVQIKTGITDHTFTQVVQVVNGELKSGDQLATGSSQTQTASAGSAMPGVGGGTRGGGGMRGGR
jgi:HlyD family secretion protein